MTLTTLAIAAAWIGCGAIGSGLTYAYFQRKFKTIADEGRFFDTIFAVFVLSAGPIGLFVALLCGGTRYGWVLPGTDPFRSRNRPS